MNPMKTRHSRSERSQPVGPTQRQLRAGELIRHSLVDILREQEIHDEDLHGISVTVTEVRCSPDLKHATVFVEPLGAGISTGTEHADAVKVVITALNRHAKYVRGLLGRRIDMRFTPDLKFRHDESFDEAERINALFRRPDVARDLGHVNDAEPDAD